MERIDSKTTIEDLKKQVKEFCDARDWDQFHNPKELAIALSIEASELLEHFRWLQNTEIDNKLKTKESEIKDELADIFYFVLRIAQMNNIDLTDALHKKMEKNNAKYPVEKAKGSNKKYSEY